MTEQMKDNRILAAAMITALMTTFMGSALNLSVPSLERAFSVNAATVSWIVSAYTITVAAMSLPFGKIADATGRRRIFLLGIAGFGGLCLACTLSPTMGVLTTLRALSGVCAAMVFATNNAILISAYPDEVRGKVLGYSVAATYIGLTAGPVLGGILNSAFGWKSIFLVAAGISLAAFLAAFRAVPKDAGSGSRGVDVTGTALYVLAIIGSLYGMTGLGSKPKAALFLAAGLAFLIAFFLWEGKEEREGRSPIMKVSMFRNSRTFTFSNLAALLNYGATFAISYEMSIYLQVILGIPSGKAGLLLIIMPAAQAVLSPLTGSLSDRVHPSYLASIGMGMCMVTLLLFARVGEETGLPYILFALCLTGIGFALFSSPNTNAILGCVEPGDYGVANSIIATMRTYGQSAGMAVLAMITAMTLGTGTLESSPHGEILRMMHISFLVFAGVCALGILFSLARNSGKE